MLVHFIAILLEECWSILEQSCWRNVGPFYSNLVGGMLVHFRAILLEGSLSEESHWRQILLFTWEVVLGFLSFFQGNCIWGTYICYLSEESWLEASCAMKEEPCWRLVVQFKKGNMLWRKVLQFLEFSWRKVLLNTLKHG